MKRSTSGKSSIKRKAGQDEQSSGQSSEKPGEQPDDARRDEAAGSKKQHLMASGASVPTTDSQSSLLDLQNDKLISDVANKKKSAIENTINDLPNEEPLSSLQKAMHEPIDKERDSCEKKPVDEESDSEMSEPVDEESDSEISEPDDEESDSEMSEPDDNEAGRSCKESPTPIDYIGECLKFKKVRLFYAQKEDLNELGVRLRSDDLSVLYEVLYNLNIERIQADQFPHPEFILESAKQVYVGDLLRVITSFIIKKFNLKHLVSTAELKPSFQLPKKGASDFAIFKKVKGKKYILAVASCKGTCPDSALEEAVDCARAAYMANGDGRTIYGLATNCIAFRLLSYNPTDKSAAKQGGFKMSKQFDYLFLRMQEKRHRKKWLKENTEIVRVIYSILCDKLNL